MEPDEVERQDVLVVLADGEALALDDVAPADFGDGLLAWADRDGAHHVFPYASVRYAVVRLVAE